MTYQTAGQMMPSVLWHVPWLSPEARKTAKLLASVVGDVEVAWAGARSPSAIASACIYVADQACNDDACTQEELASFLPVRARTIRAHYPEVPEVFIEHATDDELEQLDEEVRARLYEWAEEGM